MLRHVPILLMLAIASVSVDAPTVMLLGALAGDMVQLSPPLLLPAVRSTQYTHVSASGCQRQLSTRDLLINSIWMCLTHARSRMPQTQYAHLLL